MEQPPLKAFLKIELAIIAGAVFIVAGLAIYFVKFSSQFTPCAQPITYTLGLFDDNFGLSRQDFLSTLKEAEAVWEKPIGKDLFAYSLAGDLKINLIYDYRQQATAKLKSLGIVTKENKASYDELRARYNTLNEEYINAKKNYDMRVALFNQRKNSYGRDVQTTNKKGGASPKEYARLQSEKIALEAEFGEIKKIETILNEYVSEINSLAVVLNRLVSTLNLTVARYNEIGASRGEEFTEGDYQSIGGEQKIDVYEFSNREKLVRLLAHEFGHALGLGHVDDPKAIMYKLNTSTNEKLTGDDLTVLKARCGIQ